MIAFSIKCFALGESFALFEVHFSDGQTDQLSFKPAPTTAGSVLDERQEQLQHQKQPNRFAGVDRVTPYQGCWLTADDCRRPAAPDHYH
jgi:hypothetical protein